MTQPALTPGTPVRLDSGLRGVVREVSLAEGLALLRLATGKSEWVSIETLTIDKENQ